MSFHHETRNAFESDNLLKTFQVTVKSILKGEPVKYSHTSRGLKHLLIIEVLLQVVAFESHVHGMSRHYKVNLPSKMPNPNKNAQKTMIDASLEYKARSFIKQAKVRFRKLKQPIGVRHEILKNVDDAFKEISSAIHLRNKIGHGETFFALKHNKDKKKMGMSKFLREVSEKDVAEMNRAFLIYKSFLEFMFGHLSVGDKQSHYDTLVTVYGFFGRNDLLGKLGVKRVGGIIVSLDVAIKIEEDMKKNPPKPFTEEQKAEILSRVMNNDYPKKRSKVKS